MRLLFAICLLMFTPPAAAAVAAAAPPEQQLRTLFDSDWQWRLQSQPEYATALGDYRYDAQLSDTSLAASRADRSATGRLANNQPAAAPAANAASTKIRIISLLRPASITGTKSEL